MMKLTRTYWILVLLFFQGLAFETYAAHPQPLPIEQAATIKEDPPKKNKLALWSLILSGSGFLFLLLPIVSILSPYLFVGGVVTGIIALSKMSKTREKGKGLAIAGLIIGGVSILAIMAAVLLLLTLLG